MLLFSHLSGKVLVQQFAILNEELCLEQCALDFQIAYYAGCLKL
jgi:hypothetical protein